MVPIVMTDTQEQHAQALITLAQNEGNLAKSAKELDITPYHLRKIRDANPQAYEAIRKRFVEGLFDKAIIMADKYGDELLRRIENPEQLAKMKAKEIATVFGIMVDKINVMSTVRGRFGESQRAAEGYSELPDEELAAILEGEFREISDEAESDEDMSDTPEDELHAEKRRVSPIGAVLHRGGDTEP